MEQEGDDFQCRLLFSPDELISPVMGEIWRINMNQKIAVNFSVLYPVYFNTPVVF